MLLNGETICRDRAQRLGSEDIAGSVATDRDKWQQMIADGSSTIRTPKWFYFVASTALLAACSIKRATSCGCDTYTQWLALTSETFEPARLDIARCTSGGI